MNKIRNFRKRMLAIFLALTMCLSLVQVTAFALEEEELPETVITDTEDENTQDLGTPTVEGDDAANFNADENTTVDSTEKETTPDTSEPDDTPVSNSNEETPDADAPEQEETPGGASEEEEDTENTPEEDASVGGIPACICEIKCTADAINTACPICGVDPTACVGKEIPEEVPAQVQAFLEAVSKLPKVEDIPAEAPAGEIEALGALLAACEDAYEALSVEELAREDVRSAAETMSAVMDAIYGIQPLVEDENPLDSWDSMSEEQRKELIAGFTEPGLYRSTDWSVVAFKGPWTFPGSFSGFPGVIGDESYKAETRKLVKELIIIGNVTLGGYGISHAKLWESLEKLTLINVNLPDDCTQFTGSSRGNVALTVEGGSIGARAFQNSDVKTAILNNVTVGEEAFAAIQGLKSVTMNGGSMGARAFQYNPNLETVELNDIGSIPDEAFGDCTALTEAKITGNVTAIGKRVFYCYYDPFDGPTSVLQSVTLPSSLKSIGAEAFSCCNELQTINLENVTSIEAKAFYNCTNLKTIELSDVTFLGDQAFAVDSTIPQHNALESISLTNVMLPAGRKAENGKWIYVAAFNGTGNGNTAVTVTGGEIPDYAFYNTKLKTLVANNVSRIGQYAFFNRAALTRVTLNNVGRIDGNAFYGCKKLTSLTVDSSTQLGHIYAGKVTGDTFIPGITSRVDAIFDDSLLMDPVKAIEELTPEPNKWDDWKVAPKGDNWQTDYNYSAQLVEQARWSNANKTEAEVQVDAYYTAPKQMDFVFVADLSNSMTELGNAADQNARFYDMQSKLQDVTKTLLNAGPGYDCRVAIVTFGSKQATVKTMDFSTAYSVVKSHINSLTPLYEDTNYDLGMNAAEALVKGNANRNTTVVFLSDGAPNKGNGTAAARSIKAFSNPDGTKVQIFGVLHSPHDNGQASNAMNAVCDQVFPAHDTKSFGEAMNLAFAAVYPNYTVTIPVNPAFENVRDLETAVEVNAGTATYNRDSHSITWTITGMPFTKHTLTYRMSLTAENAGRYGDQSYPVNANNSAEIKSANPAIESGNTVASPVLNRSVASPEYTVTVNYYLEGTSIPVHDAESIRQNANTAYDVTEYDQIVIPGYTYSRTEGSLTGTLDGDKAVNVYYTRNTAQCTVTVNYYLDGTTTVLHTPNRTTGAEGSPYDVTVYDQIAIPGYTYSRTEGSLTGTLDGDKVINVYYTTTPTTTPILPPPDPTPTPTPTPIPDNPTPLAPGGDTTTIPDIEVPLAAPGLNSVDHYAYIIGYPDGLVHPEANITRAEVATIFFRLMTDEFRTEHWATENAFLDVAALEWFNNSVSTSSKAGIVKGYEDGTFRPNNNITRAEFAAIAARFLSDDVELSRSFSDISGHWAENEINRAVMAGWIKGYTDGTFRPDQPITRAEAVTMINRMLDRTPDKDHMLEDMIRWPDNTEDKWYYDDMQEATNSHDYERLEGILIEDWTELLENRDWAALQEEWSTAASAPGGEVADNLDLSKTGENSTSQDAEPAQSENT